MTERRTSSIRRLLIGYLCMMASLGGGFALGTAMLVRAADRDRTAALIDNDLAATLDKIGTDPAMQRDRALAIVLARGVRGDDRLYRLTAGDRVLAGLPASVGFRHIGDTLESEAPPALAREVSLGSDTTLLIGRRLEQSALTHRLLEVSILTLAAAFVLAGAIGLIVTRWLAARVDAINAACDQVRMGDFAARAPANGKDDEFSRLGRHVNDMLERIDALVSGLRDVSNQIAHDLRTPVARLKTNIEAAAAAGDLSISRKLAGAAAAETDELLQTFEALLDIAEVEAASTGGLAPIRLEEATQAALDLYDSVAEAADVRLVRELQPVTLLGERMLVIRLAANLIDNAIKFSNAGTRVTIKVGQEGDGAVLRVTDQGPGIPPEERARVLNRFERGRAVLHVPGHGLGLALVGAVAKRHGATAEFADAGPGLVATIRFPLFREPPVP